MVPIAGRFFVPDATVGTVAAVGLTGAAAMVYGAVTQRSPRQDAWLMIALGITVLSVADVVLS